METIKRAMRVALAFAVASMLLAQATLVVLHADGGGSAQRLEPTGARGSAMEDTSDTRDLATRAGTTITVDDDGPADYAKILWAVENASAGDTVFVRAGTYHENVVIDKSIDLVGEDRNTTVIDGQGSGAVVELASSWVNVSGLNITNGDIGILGENVDNCTITEDNVHGNLEYGIKLNNTENNTIYHNNFIGNAKHAWDNGTNDWNLTYPTGGNYWSGYVTPDIYYGALQDQTGADGIVDNRYYISGGDGGSIPDGYYDAAAGKSGDELKGALHNIIKGHTEYSYSQVEEILKDTDEDPNNPDNVILLYTGWSYPKSSFGGGISDWNREHVWSKSHGGFDDNPPAGTDVHHLRPTDVSVNSARGSLDFDVGGSQYIDGDGPTLCYRDSDSWEPWDEVKGDVARMMFYMATRYEGTDTSYDLELVDTIPSSPSGEPLFAKLSILLQWHEDDPVSDWERTRNDKIYYNWQGNRNPFIDHPEYVDSIWGSGNPPTGGGGGNIRDYYPFVDQDGWISRVHNLNKGLSYRTISLALAFADEGDEIVAETGTYNENIIIDKAINMTGTGGAATFIDGGGSGSVLDIQSDWVNVSGFTITNSGAELGNSGIRIANAAHCHLIWLNVTDCDRGISFGSSSNNNTVRNCTLQSNAVGVYTEGQNNTIYHNNFLSNTNHAIDNGNSTWDMGYPVGGNHYDNWTTPDDDVDGFVDDPYVMPSTASGSGGSIDLNGYTIEQYSDSKTWTFSGTTIVEPGDYVIVGRNAAKSSFETYWGVTFGTNVHYFDAQNSGSDFMIINGGQTFELFEPPYTSIDGPTGYAIVSNYNAERTATTADATLEGSWNVRSETEATPGSGANGDDTAGLVINEYSDSDNYLYEFVELYYDASTGGGSGGSSNSDEWPFAIWNGWLATPPGRYLPAGRHLISLDRMQSDETLETVLSSIAGRYSSVQWYDASSREWQHWNGAKNASGYANTLTHIDHTMGLYVEMTAPGYLDLPGSEHTNESNDIWLYPGWNLVGFPGTQETLLAATALAGIFYNALERFNGTTGQTEAINPGVHTLERGRGYWLYCNHTSPQLWDVP